HNSSSAFSVQRGEDVEDERIVAVLSRRCPEGCSAPEPAVGVLEAFLAKDLLTELPFLLLVVALLLRPKPPGFIREREVGQDEREPADTSIRVEKLGIGQGARTRSYVSVEAV